MPSYSQNQSAPSLRVTGGVLAAFAALNLFPHDAFALLSPPPSPEERGEILLKSAQAWDMDEIGLYFQYIPRWVTADRVSLVVLVHGTPGAVDGDPGDAEDGAFAYIERSVDWADRHQVILIAPVFDQTNFGSFNSFVNPFGPDTGNYRSLLGRPRTGLAAAERDPDEFLNSIIDDYSALYDEGQSLPYIVEQQVFLYGHSAGGQFASRYFAKWPENVAAVFLSSPRRLTFPQGDPFGEGSNSPACSPSATDCNFPWATLLSSPNTIWPDGGDPGSGTIPYSWTFDLDDANFDVAAEVPAFIMVSKDDEPPALSGQSYGEVHYERSLAWASQMGADWDTYAGGHSSANSQTQHAHPFFEEQPAVAGDRHRHWWVPLI